MIKMKLGRKTISKDGEKMTNRNFRATNAEWADCLSFGGGKWIRDKIRLEKIKLKTAEGK